MDTKNAAGLFSDDFADLFNEADMEIEEFQNPQDSVSSLIRLLEDERSVQKRFASVQKLVLQFVPITSIMDVDKKILQHLMPAVKDLLGDILKEISQELPATNAKEKSTETFHILQEYLQMCIGILEILDNILKYISKNETIDLLYIRSVPLNMIQILHLTFQHCKDSENLYNGYIEDLKEILALFKGAQVIHVKLLKLLERQLSVDHLAQKEVMLVQYILEVLGEIGEILVDMNIKALADNWKSYMALAQKFADLLNQHSFNIDRPLAFLASEISRNLKNALKMDANDLNASSQDLKICNFFVRVAVKLCDTFWSNLDRICNAAWSFILSIYKFFPPFLRFGGYPDNLVDQIDSLIFVGCDSLLDKLLYEQEFYKALSKIDVNKDTPPSLLFLLTSVFQKLSIIMRSDQEILRLCQVSSLVNLFFEIVKNNYCHFFWKITIQALPTEKQSLYDDNVKNITLTLLSLNQEQYHKVEVLLFKNILQGSIWCTLLATDIWCSLLRQRNPKLGYEVLCSVVMKTKPLLLHNFTDRPETVFLRNFLRRLYTFLPEDYKKLLVDAFPPSLPNLYVWKVLGFKNFPKTQVFMIESLLINIMEKIEGFLNGKSNMDDFHLMCTGFEAMSSLPIENMNVRHFVSMIVCLWNFELISSLKNNVLFTQFIPKLCDVTDGFIFYFNNEQLLLVLTKLKQLLNANFNIKMYAAQILRSLATKPIVHSPDQAQITSVISEIFRSLLLDANPIVRQSSLEIFLHFVNATPHDEIVQNAVKHEKQLQLTISNFIKKNVGDEGTIGIEEYFAMQEEHEFKHRCSDFPQAKQRNGGIDIDEVKQSVTQKRFPIDNAEIDLVVNRIKNDVELVHKLSGKESAVKENVAEIIGILTRQINCKI